MYRNISVILLYWGMSNQIFTIIEASVEESRWNELEDKYIAVDKESLPTTVLNSNLVQDTSDPKIWRITTVWESLDAMKTYRASIETPIWLQIFQEVNADPALIINDIKQSK